MGAEVARYACYLVDKMPKSGTLVLCTHELRFVPVHQRSRVIRFEYSEVKSTALEGSIARSAKSLLITTTEGVFTFVGIQEAEKAKDLIQILQKASESETMTQGFTAPVANTAKWVPLENAIQVANVTFNKPFSVVYPMLETNDFISRFYVEMGNRDVVISPWINSDGYQERVIAYIKTVIVPVFGTNYIQVKEYHRMFKLEDGFGLHVTTDLGKTPYADCFAPHVQMVIRDVNDKVEITSHFAIIWSSEPFVKPIVEKKTGDEISGQYAQMFKRLQSELGLDAETEETPVESSESAVDNFRKFQKIYKILIITLISLIGVVFAVKNWPEDSFRHTTNRTLSVLSLAAFLLGVLLF